MSSENDLSLSAAFEESNNPKKHKEIPLMQKYCTRGNLLPVNNKNYAV